MLSSNEDEALAKNLYQFKKIQFVENGVGIFKDKLQKGRNGHFTENVGNMKRRP